MAHEVKMSIKGSRQGKFRGQNHGRWIPVASFNMGMPTIGPRPHLESKKPVKISVPWGNWSPQIFAAMVNYEELEAVTFQINGGGGGSYDWVKLSSAFISNVATHSGGKEKTAGQVQEITFKYMHVSLGTGHHTTSHDCWDLENAARDLQDIKLGQSGAMIAIAGDWTV